MSYVKEGVRREMATHTLEVHLDTPQLKAWYLRPPNGGRMQSTFILATVEGLVVMGDWCPESNRGAISCYGYDEKWFASRLSEQYLCSKFLRPEWVADIGFASLCEHIRDARRQGRITKDDARDATDNAVRAHEYADLTYERAYEIFSDLGLSDFEDLGQDYNPRDAGILCAIQQRFAELYHATPPSPSTEEHE